MFVLLEDDVDESHEGELAVNGLLWMGTVGGWDVMRVGGRAGGCLVVAGVAFHVRQLGAIQLGDLLLVLVAALSVCVLSLQSFVRVLLNRHDIVIEVPKLPQTLRSPLASLTKTPLPSPLLHTPPHKPIIKQLHHAHIILRV